MIFCNPTTRNSHASNPADYIEASARDTLTIWNGPEANDELLNKLGLDNLNSTGSNFLRNRLARNVISKSDKS